MAKHTKACAWWAGAVFWREGVVLHENLAEERGGERKHISAAVGRSRMIIGPPHWGQDQVEVEGGGEFLFQVVAERAEKAAVIMTTNLPFSEWTQVIPNARLCKALLDRITDRAHILETGTESYRFRRTAEKRNRSGKTEESKNS